MEVLLLVLDLIGTFVFALSGAAAGIKRRVDLFGVLVLWFAAANAGGITRDVLIGAVPPAALSDWRYLTVSLLAGVITFYWTAAIVRMQCRAPSSCSTPSGSRFSRCPARRRRSSMGSTRSWRRCSAC